MTQQVIVKNPKMYAFVLMISGFMGLFSETALNMALTDIMQDFQVPAATVQWLTTGYLLVMACLVPASSYLIKWFNTKSLVITGILLSLAGVLIGAVAPNFGVLLFGRIIQALGTGMLLPIMMTVLMFIFPVEKRGAIMGIMGLVITAGPALGPTLSGIIISALSWHFIFWISAMLYIVVLILAFWRVENVGEITRPKIDIISIFLSTIAFAGLVFALSTMAEAAVTNVIVWLPLAIGIVSLVTFIIRQFKLESPMLNLNVFKYPMFVLGAVMVFVTILCVLSTGILLPLYLKGALLYSAVIAGLILLPGNAVNLVLSPVIGSLFDRFGARYFGIIGFFCILVAAIIFAVIISASTPVWAIILTFMILFAGISLVMMPAQTNALNQLPRALYADGSATITTLIQVGGSASTALSITLYTASMNMFMKGHAHTTNEVAIAHSVQYVFYFIIGLAMIGLICACFVKKPKAI
ncbi:DHA2 family efflux MFS transporter permease subunit [Staphylococcus succinus]|uniref:MFS transporter n=1 Tax=Staphylococcus succinus TaxID=61015 RepID=A0ABX5IM31_9STAP|nr:DHA2 family efflux MFS transporter permease subunit [Staphylococcus succinus]PTI68895.1 MFS transporter [Staphylococcus succinus]RIN40429.1 DHA2 family efflux MFS transporter permease subunit [Staphylococcus succinus]